MAPMGLQETDIYDLKNLISELEKEESQLELFLEMEKTNTKKTPTIKLAEDNNERPASKFEVMNQSELFATADKLEWLLWEQHRIANPGKKLEPIVLTIDVPDEIKDLLLENETNISPTFDDKKPESSEKSELLIDVKSLNKLLEDPEQDKKENSKSGKTDKHKRRAQRLEREKALLDRAENLLNTMEKGLIYTPEIKDQNNSPAKIAKCFLYGLLGLLTSYFFQIIF